MNRCTRWRLYRASCCGLHNGSAIVLLLSAVSAHSAPPFKTTDANTADPYVLEARLGLLQASRDRDSNEILSPMLRTNFGLPGKVELVSEFEYSQSNHEIENGAVGIKWIPVFGQFSFGIETLSFLPIRTDDNGYGIESQLLFTWRHDNYQIHFNAGGFHDPRGAETLDGWRSGLLVEKRTATRRDGIELFARRKRNQETDLRLGYGLIRSLGAIEIRAGVHVGLSAQAPDVGFNFWLSREFGFGARGSE
jgi:hypothetical protein